MKRLLFPLTQKEAEKQGVQYSSQKNRDALFPTILRKLREDAGISQATLAKSLNISKSTIGLYETGDTLPDAKTLYNIANYFGVSSDFILGLSLAKSTDPDIKATCKTLGLSEDVVRKIVKSCKDPDSAFAFMVLLDTTEFWQIIDTIIAFLTINAEGSYSENDLVALDDEVRKQTKGALRVVPALIEKALILESAKRYLEDAMNTIDKNTKPPIT